MGEKVRKGINNSLTVGEALSDTGTAHIQAKLTSEINQITT